MQQFHKLKLMFKSLWLLLAYAFMFSACDSDGVMAPDGDHNNDVTVVEEFSFKVEVRNQSRFRLEGVTATSM